MSREQSKRTIPYAPKCIARRRILVAGMGISPAVLTSFVLGLTHAEKTVVSDEENFRGYNRSHPNN